MDSDKKLEEQIKQYQELTKESGGKINVSDLMIQALEKSQSNLTSSKQKHWAYLISLGLPPLGLIFAAKFWLSGKDDGNRLALICVILTAFSILLLWASMNYMLSASGVNYNQLQQAPVQMQQLLQ